MRVDLLHKVLGASILVISSACSQQLARSKAADLLKADPEWSKVVTTSAQIGGVHIITADLTFEKKLQSLGYVQVRGPLDFRVGYSYIVDMTQKGEATMRERGWILSAPTTTGPFGGTEPSPQPRTLSIPIGRRQLVEVTGIVGDEHKATAEFIWQMECTETGKEIGCNAEKQSGKRKLTRYDDGWRLDPAKT